VQQYLYPFPGRLPYGTYSRVMDMSNPLLPLLGLLGAAWAGNHALTGGPKPSGGRRTKRVASGSSTGMNPVNRADLSVRPPDASSVPRSVPRSVTNQVVWDSVKIDGTLSSGTSITEANFSGSLSLHPQAAQWAQLFDQWTIPQMSVTFRSVLAPGSTAIPPDLYTALDFDSVGNLGTVTAIEDFSTCAVLPLEPGRTVTRTIRPCCKPLIGSTSITGLARSWIDSSFTNIQFLAIRSIIGTTTGAITPIVHTTFTIWFAFRNQI